MVRDLPQRRNTWLVFAGVSGGWLLFTCTALAAVWAASAAKGKEFDLLNSAIWNMGWVLWIGGTYLVAAIIRRFPIESGKTLRCVGLYAVLGVGVTFVVLTAEYGVTFLLERRWPETVLIHLPLSFITYKFHVYYLVYWLLVGACSGYQAHMRLQQSELTASQLKAELAQSQVQALKMQLHPHFLFNTHHSIISLMLNKDNAAAIKMLTRLSDLLRITLKRSDQPTSSLGEELQIIDLYLGIQRERYRDRLDVGVEVAPSTLEAEIPSLLLQPLVENAIEHGIDPQTTAGRLVITAARERDELVLTVRDNGPGFPAAFKLESDAGVGLGNTRARLERIYGTDHRLVIQAAAEGGAEVRVTLPFRLYQPPTANEHAGAKDGVT